MTYWTSSSGVYFEPYPDDFGTWSRNSSHSVGFGFSYWMYRRYCWEKVQNISGVKLLRRMKNEYFCLHQAWFKFLVFNAVKQGFFLVRKEWLESFYILLLYYWLYRRVSSTHFSPKAAKKNWKNGRKKLQLSVTFSKSYCFPFKLTVHYVWQGWCTFLRSCVEARCLGTYYVELSSWTVETV